MKKTARRPRRLKAQVPPLVARDDAAGVDLGATLVTAALPPSRPGITVRTFATFTPDLQALVAWFKENGIRTVAMEATSVYWIPLYTMLEDAGIEICLVNARHLKNVPGRKTDVADAQWLQQLHAVGLLHASFHPPVAIRVVRTLWRHRDSLVREAARQVQLMHKALDQMNLHVHHVLSDLMGESGSRMVEAILKGERDAVALAKHFHWAECFVPDSDDQRATYKVVPRSWSGSGTETDIITIDPRTDSVNGKWYINMHPLDVSATRVLRRESESVGAEPRRAGGSCVCWRPDGRFGRI